MSRVLVIQHVPHERLGTFEPVFKAAGCDVTTLHVAAAKMPWPSAEAFDGLVIMGGPQSAYEQEKYPYLKRELGLIQQALKANRPVLGVCLGAQMLAVALGAKIMKNPSGREVGWYPLMREPAADTDPLAEPFGQTETVFQWHGDTFSLPKGAVRLFSSPLCQEQAFRYGPTAYGVQFHVEITDAMIRAWLAHAGNKKELSALKGQIDPAAIRAQSGEHLSRLQELSRHVAGAFCAFLQPASRPSGSAYART